MLFLAALVSHICLNNTGREFIVMISCIFPTILPNALIENSSSQILPNDLEILLQNNPKPIIIYLRTLLKVCIFTDEENEFP